MLWIIILCHLIADYPLQTQAMVKAKQNLVGLLMHVSIHFLTMVVMLSGIFHYSFKASFAIAFTVSFFHFCIDLWKNILSTLRPKWVIFIYIQDQVLHVLSIIVSVKLFSYFGLFIASQVLDISNFILILSFILVTHVWFVTEKVLSYKHKAYQQAVTKTMWSRMMSRAIFLSCTILGLNFWSVLVIVGGILVVWSDLQENYRYQMIALDLFGVCLWLVLLSFL